MSSNQAQPGAASVCGSGIILAYDEERELLTLQPLYCRKWTCKTCRVFLKIHVQALARAGKPDRHMVLTVRPDPDRTPEAFRTWLVARFAALVREIRKIAPDFAYFRVIELTKSGTPHLHCLTRGRYFSQRWLKQTWTRLTGSWNVHLSAIRNRSGGINEVTKYITNSFQRLAAQGSHIRVYSCSRDWLPPGFDEDPFQPVKDPNAIVIPATFQDAQEMVQRLGAELSRDPVAKNRWCVSWPRPPDRDVFELIYEFGTWANLRFAGILAYWAPSFPRDHCTLDDWLLELETARWGDTVTRRQLLAAA